MTSIDEAARALAVAEAQRVRAEEILALAAETWAQAEEAYELACGMVRDATAALIDAVNPPLVPRMVKRPAGTADELLDLDDVGGR